MSGPSWMYGDPSKVVERLEGMRRKDEERLNGGKRRPMPDPPGECEGCIHKARVFGVEYCTEGRTHHGRVNMRRCAEYETKGVKE